MNILEYQNYQETKMHGDSGFPYITYPCSIPLDFSCVPLHWHDDMEIIYIKKGNGIVSVDLNRYPAEAGSILFILPGQLHSIEQDAGSSMEYENIIFHLSLLLSKQTDSCTSDFFTPLFNRQISIPVKIDARDAFYQEISSCIDTADEICTNYPYAYQFAIKSQLYRLFFLLFSNSRKADSPVKQKKSLEQLKTVLKYVEEHYAQHISIEQISSVLGFSQSHFMKFFKTNMNISFIEYVNDYRLSIASRLLLSSSSSILFIAEECGFDNLSYFNRLFKSKYGVTPSKFRQVSDE